MSDRSGDDQMVASITMRRLYLAIAPDMRIPEVGQSTAL